MTYAAAVDFEDSPELAAFRAEVRAFLDANAELKRGDERDWSRNGAATDPDVAADYRARCREWQRLLHDSGWAGLAWPSGLRRSWAERRAPDRVQPGARPVRRDVRVHHRGPGARRTDAHGARHPGAAAALPGPAAVGRGVLVPAVLRARRRLRSGGARHPGRARRRRVGRQRPEGVDLERAARGLRHPRRAHRPRRAQARGPHLLHRRHAQPGHRGPAAGPGPGRGALQRGVPLRRARARLPTSSARSAVAGRSRARRCAARAR